MSSTASSPASTTSAGNGRARATPAAARRQRVLWDSDNATRGGKTSIGILLDWLTAPGNYARWRDGKSQSGETREMLCTEIKGNMYREGIHHRENANIRTQISELERGFEAARVWLEENGCDPNTFERRADAEGPEPEMALDGGRNRVESHVLRMCRYYHVLNEVFGKDDVKGRSRRPYHRSSAAKKQKFEHEEVLVAEPPVEMDAEEEAARVPLSLPSVAAPATAVPAPVSTALTGNWNSPAALANYESTQRLLTEAVREEREKKRFAMEEERHKLECEKLRYEVEAVKLQVTMDRALARKKLLDAGLPDSQVDELFPK